MADEAKKEEVAKEGMPQSVDIVIKFYPGTGQMQFQTPRDPIVALGMLDMCRREVYGMISAAPAVAPKIEVVPATALPAAAK